MRATQSAEILSRRLGVPYEIEQALTEYDVGIYEGRSDDEGWREYGRVLQEWLIKGNWDERMEGGESLNDMRARFVPFLNSLVEEYGNTSGSLVLVGHGGTYRCMLPLVLDNVNFSFSLSHEITNTSYVLAEKSDLGLVCLTWGDYVL